MNFLFKNVKSMYFNQGNLHSQMKCWKSISLIKGIALRELQACVRFRARCEVEKKTQENHIFYIFVIKMGGSAVSGRGAARAPM